MEEVKQCGMNGRVDRVEGGINRAEKYLHVRHGVQNVMRAISLH